MLTVETFLLVMVKAMSLNFHLEDSLVFFWVVQVGGVVALDPDILGNEQIQSAVEARLLDTSISVREAAMELVGKYIVGRPLLAKKVSLSRI
jgi:hypothetical protein